MTTLITKDELTKLAKQAGFNLEFDDYVYEHWNSFQAFAKLVAQHERNRIIAANELVIEHVNEHIKHLHYAVQAEREACAIACETDGKDLAGLYYAGVIRARGEPTLRGEAT
jgi:hypothetical protein